jgi:hypothetical protein
MVAEKAVMPSAASRSERIIFLLRSIVGRCWQGGFPQRVGSDFRPAGNCPLGQFQPYPRHDHQVSIRQLPLPLHAMMCPGSSPPAAVRRNAPAVSGWPSIPELRNRSSALCNTGRPVKGRAMTAGLFHETYRRAVESIRFAKGAARPPSFAVYDENLRDADREPAHDELWRIARSRGMTPPHAAV